VQLHGGMGMTEELAIGHYFKRLTAIQYEFGSADYHLARYAELTNATDKVVGAPHAGGVESAGVTNR
jgi:alkylation response protein AidB-like acyl-CoA dehydrogenase